MKNSDNNNLLKTHWPVHPIAELFPRMSPEERAECKKDLQERFEHGVDPCEHSILLYEQQILHGRHRDECWMELGEENACNGFFRHNLPPTTTLADKHGTLVAWMRAKSANMVHRHISADQKAAIFLKAVDTFPELQAVVLQIAEENAQRQKGGKPLDAGDQRGNTAKVVAELANVGATTMKTVKRVKKAAPTKFEEIAQGKTTAKKAMNEIQKTKKATSTQIERGTSEQNAEVSKSKQGDQNTPSAVLTKAQQLVISLDDVNWSNEDEKQWAKTVMAISETVLQGFNDASANRNLSMSKALTGKVTVRKLQLEYGVYAVPVLHAYLEELPKKKKGIRSFQIIKPLPDKAEFKEMATTRYTATVAQLVESAFSIFEDLATELGDWYDNLPESFQSGDKGSVLEDGKNTLENLSTPDLSEEVEAIAVEYFPPLNTNSRSARNNDAIARLQAVMACPRWLCQSL